MCTWDTIAVVCDNGIPHAIPAIIVDKISLEHTIFMYIRAGEKNSGRLCDMFYGRA